MIPIYTGQPQQQKPTPALTIAETHGRCLEVHVVDPRSGRKLAVLVRLGCNNGQLLDFGGAERAISDNGFSTDWAEWSDDGKFLGFK